MKLETISIKNIISKEFEEQHLEIKNEEITSVGLCIDIVSENHIYVVTVYDDNSFEIVVDHSEIYTGTL